MGVGLLNELVGRRRPVQQELDRARMVVLPLEQLRRLVLCHIGDVRIAVQRGEARAIEERELRVGMCELSVIGRGFQRRLQGVWSVTWASIRILPTISASNSCCIVLQDATALDTQAAQMQAHVETERRTFRNRPSRAEQSPPALSNRCRSPQSAARPGQAG